MTLTPEHFPHIDRQRERFMELLASFRPDEQQRLRDALDFAEREHTGQFRRGRILVPFIIHPIRVTCTLVDELGLRDVDALVAALLHDVAEDCGISVASIGEHFGKEVQTLVRWLTWEEGTDMKWEQAKRMLRAPHLARLIKTSDIIDNSRSMWRVDQRGEVLRLLYGYEHWGGPIVASIGDHAQWLHQDALRRSAAYHFSNEREPSIEPNAGKELERSSNDKRFVRYPIHTHVIEKDDDLVDLVHKYATQYLRIGDVLAISERVVAITQGRAYRIEDINPSWLARLLVRFVTRNPAGIGLASPW
ncbi:MAG: HD domain-containing protein, partial [Candidatus Uhrbacteria bacterium]